MDACADVLLYYYHHHYYYYYYYYYHRYLMADDDPDKIQKVVCNSFCDDNETTIMSQPQLNTTPRSPTTTTISAPAAFKKRRFDR